jgi:hypothetical protein
LTVLVLAGGLALSGCAGVRGWECWEESVLPFAERKPDASEILTQCRQAASLPREEQEVLLKNLRGDYEQEKDPETRLKLVCLALQPDRSHQDRVWARDLLKTYLAQENSQEDLAALAWLLENLVSRNLVLQQKLDEERKRADTLAGKLKALEDIEKIIRKREEGGLAPPME